MIQHLSNKVEKICNNNCRGETLFCCLWLLLDELFLFCLDCVNAKSKTLILANCEFLILKKWFYRVKMRSYF